MNPTHVAFCMLIAAGCHAAAALHPTNIAKEKPSFSSTQAHMPVEIQPALPAAVSIYFANQLFLIRVSNVDLFQTWSNHASVHPNACEEVRKVLQKHDRWSSSEQALLLEMQKQACPVYQAMQTQEKLPVRGKTKRAYTTEDVVTASPTVLKWLSSCQSTRGELGRLAAEQLKAWVTVESNKNKILFLLRFSVPCLGTRGIYPVDFDTIVLPRIRDRLANESTPEKPKRIFSRRVRRSR